MSYRILDLKNLQIDAVEQDAQRLALRFDRANIEKIMDNADQRTLWTQAGMIELRHPRLSAELPPPPFPIARADVEDGRYTQRDMIRIPLEASGEIVLSLWLEGREEPVRLGGDGIRLQLEGDPRYVRHVD